MHIVTSASYIYYESTMWSSVLTLIVFVSLHDGTKSDLLDAAQGYVSTAVFGDTQIHNRASTWDTAPSIQGKEGDVLTYSNSEHTAIRVSVAGGNQPYLEGSEINIVCNVDGDLTPTIVWYKNGKLIQSNNRISFTPFALIISAAEQSDAGRYRCQAINEHSSAAATVDIRVGALNYPIITERPWQNNRETVAAGAEAGAGAGAAAVAGSFGAPNYPILTERPWQNNQDTAAAGAGAVAVAGSFGAPNYPILTERPWQNNRDTAAAGAAAVAGSFGAPNYPIITERPWQNNGDTAAAAAGSFGAPNHPIITERTWQNNQDTAVAAAEAVGVVAATLIGNRGSFTVAAASA